MKNIRSILAALLAGSIVHGSVAQAAVYAPSAPKPIERNLAVLPLSPRAAQAAPASLPAAQQTSPQPFLEAPTADSVLQEMAAELSAGQDAPDLARYYEGGKIRQDAASVVLADGLGAESSPLPAARAAGAPQTGAIPAPQSPSEHAAVIGPGVIVAIVAGVIAVGTGIYMWMRGKNKNEAWQNSKSNQDIVALEKARRDHDAQPLGKIKAESRGRQQRMDERVANAQSAGSKTVELSDGKSISVKEAQTYAAFDGLVAARAEMNENAVSQDPAQRVGGDLPATWQQRLSGLESAAKQSELEGSLALSLKAMRGELSRQDQAAAVYDKDIARFDERVPGLFGGRLKEMTGRGRKDLEEFKAAEISPEKALFEKANGAMRGRVSDRLSAKDAEYQGHLARLDNLSQAAEGTLKSAVEMAQQVDKDMADMASHEKSRAFNLMMASQHESDPVYDQNGRIVRYEDNSATWKALAASAGAEARASAASAQAGVKALNTIVPLLHKDPVLKAEGLSFALPSNPGRGPSSNGSVFFDFWMPASWNFFMTMFSESQAQTARAGFAPIKGSLENVLAEVNARRGAERAWTDKQIDRVLQQQMGQAPRN